MDKIYIITAGDSFTDSHMPFISSDNSNTYLGLHDKLNNPKELCTPDYSFKYPYHLIYELWQMGIEFEYFNIGKGSAGNHVIFHRYKQKVKELLELVIKKNNKDLIQDLITSKSIKDVGKSFYNLLTKNKDNFIKNLNFVLKQINLIEHQKINHQKLFDFLSNQNNLKLIGKLLIDSKEKIYSDKNEDSINKIMRKYSIEDKSLSVIDKYDV
jgi:hypothetical protein